MTKTRVVINYPIGGLKELHPHKTGNRSQQDQPGSNREGLFWRIVRTCREATAEPIIVVVSEDTIDHAGVVLEDLQNDPRFRECDLRVHLTWSVDTCQAWLAGWGVALGKLPRAGLAGDMERIVPPADDDRIVLLPGDLDNVDDPEGFFTSRLPGFLNGTDFEDVLIGDFTAEKTTETLASKDVIDLFGTYPLFELWFPEVASATRNKKISKPRSEFLNIRVGALKELLTGEPGKADIPRKFAYEQTLNMLIHCWDFAKAADLRAANAGEPGIQKAGAPRGASETWKHTVAAYPLGELKDDPDSRNIPGAIDQIERTERMLKMIWREFQFRDARAKAGAHARARADAGAVITSEGEEPPAFNDDLWHEIYHEAYSEKYNEESVWILREYDRLEANSRAIEVAARVNVLAFLSK